MGKRHSHGVESTAAIAHHPIHPILIVFPAASLIGAPAADLAFRLTKDPFWARASSWLLGTGVVSGLAAAVPGLIDYVAIKEVRKLASGNVHAAGNLVAIGLAGWNFARRRDEGRGRVDDLDIALSIGAVALLGVTAWLGGELSYRHGIGAIADSSDDIVGETVKLGRKALR